MTPQKQKNIHDPENGIYGDCDRAVIASMLDMDIEDVPHFWDGIPDNAHPTENDVGLDRRDSFLSGVGMESISIALCAPDPKSIIKDISATNPGRYFILMGESKAGTNHVVICHNGEIAHDPSLNGSGIIGPAKGSGLYWIEFIVPKMEEARCL